MADWPASWCVDVNPAYKVFIRDLVNCQRENNLWKISFGDTTVRTLLQFQLQVTVERLMGLQNEIMIVSDSTGKAKLTRGNKVPGQFTWLKQGVLCSVVGTLVDNGKLPHVGIIKLAPVHNPIQREMWPIEVTELRNYLSNKSAPNIDQAITSGTIH